MRTAWHFVILLPVLLLPVVMSQDSTCSNGLVGYEASGACCPVSCGRCGGVGCGTLGDGCCTKDVLASNVYCSESGAAPCIVESIIVDTNGPECSNGFPGYEASGVCCNEGCGKCGGVGCRNFGGEDDECCVGKITSSDMLCSDTGSAPCIIDNAGGDDVTSSSSCSNGFAGYEASGVCCPTSCGRCGGVGCSKLGDGCCTKAITASEVLCSVSGEAPCIIDNIIDTVDMAAPTPTPSTPTVMVPYTEIESISPVDLMTIPTSCDAGTQRPAFRYAASSGKINNGRLYAEGEGCFTMTDIYDWRGTVSSGGVLSSKGPIYQLDDEGNVVDPVLGDGTNTGKWLLSAELYITGGAIFYCKGSGAGGDCDELRIQSNGPEDFYEVRGYGGSLYFESTLVTSWDTTAKAPQEIYEGGRSYLNCVSEKLTGETCEGRAKNDMGECRMDIINSEMGYMGYLDSESYGLTWKVRGFCSDLSNPDVFDTTNVYGDIVGSEIHHMYYGHYSYGHEGGVWVYNTMRDNHQYGFDPHDDSDYLTIAYNKVYNNHNHGIIASKRCNNVHIYNNEVYDGGPSAVGIFLHRSSDFAEVYNNHIHDMQDGGLAMLETMYADIHDNLVEDTRFGIRMSLGSANNQVHDNTFDTCSEWGLYTYEGSDQPTAGVSNGRPSDNTFDGNRVLNSPDAVKFKASDNLVVTGNTFTGASQLEFFDAQDTTWSGNTIPSSGVCVKNVASDKGVAVPVSTFVNDEGIPDVTC